MERSDQQNVTLWKRELLAAGWKPYKGMATTWQAPNGELFIGPYAAWKRMKATQEKERNHGARE